ncbi:tRNA (adenosine(37)-N6)-threonylcarbamoyltransferase complex dimerization subunit type 1 TsaB [Paraglaciecola aestuariivivens]
MNILVIDTATEACSVALEINQQVFHRFEICPQQHSQRILPMIDELLKEANCQLQDLDYLGFGRGPGSFTGVRIATGILQGLALGMQCKVVGVSTLAAMAQQALAQEQSQSVIAAIDARMSEVYFGQYQAQNGLMGLVAEEQVLAPEDAIAIMQQSSGAGVGTGWQAYPKLCSHSSVQPLAEILYPNALYMLPLAKAQVEQGQAVEVEDIQPVYLRDKVTWKKLPGRD